MHRFRRRGLVSLLVLVLTISSQAETKPSDWQSAPKPKFPKSALESGVEGSVRLRVVLTPEGKVTRATVLKSSGNPELDQVARDAVLKWRMKPSAIKPSDLSHGRDTIIDFRQEPILFARYPDRAAYFASEGGTIRETELSRMWLSAPFPSYPYDARSRWEEGRVLIRVTIGKEGIPQNVHVFNSSGHQSLDNAAVRAVKLWRARKEYIGREITFPINFTMRRRR